MIKWLEHLCYKERLRKLRLLSLKKRRLKGIFLYMQEHWVRGQEGGEQGSKKEPDFLSGDRKKTQETMGTN